MSEHPDSPLFDQRFYLIWSKKHKLYISDGRLYISERMAKAVIRRLYGYEDMQVHEYRVDGMPCRIIKVEEKG